MSSRVFSFIFVLTSVAVSGVGTAYAASFSDLPADHWGYEAVEYLKTRGILSGYPDGTFQPEKAVNRAEAVKIIVAPLAPKEELTQGTSIYSDVPEGAWYIPYIEHARSVLGIVDGPPAKTAFEAERPVLKIEFLKMLLLANKVDPNSFGEIRLPLAKDVTNPSEWYYPFVRYAMTASMLTVQEDGMLQPGKELTRGEVAVLLYRYLMYTEGRRTQALFTEVEKEIETVERALETGDLPGAEFASARGLLLARGAHAAEPNTPLVQGALKIAEAFRALVRAYRAGTLDQLEEVIRLCSDAWHLAAKAQELSSNLKPVSEQVQQISKTMADTARATMDQDE